jgi:ABC-2 type transport system permease protein
MRKICFIVQKELIQIFRNRIMARILLLMPIVQLLVLTYAANFEIKNIRLFVVDQDHSQLSRELLAKIQSSGYFVLEGQSISVGVGYDQLDNDKADAVITIPVGFERMFYRKENVQIQLLINAINGTKATLANSYLNAIIIDFKSQTSAKIISGGLDKPMPNSIAISYRNWYNPELDYKIYMSPGILVMLVTMIAMFFTSINIVREKEMGTIEQLNVTTIGKWHFIIGKLIPFWMIGLVNFFIGLGLIRLFFGVPIEGNLFLVFLFVNIYLFALLGFGMLISTITHTQQQAMFISWFFMVIFILLSGLFTPIEFMPGWAKAITKLNPVALFVQFMRLVVLKGSGFSHVTHLFFAIIAYAIVVNGLAVYNYRKTSS